MGTIQIKKVEKTVTTGKQGEERQKVKKTTARLSTVVRCRCTTWPSTS